VTSVFSLLLNTLALGIRNLTRRKGRTALALIAIASGVVAMLLSGGFIQWIYEAIRESTIHSQLGHIRIARPGYAQQGSADPFGYVIAGTPAELSVISRLPEVKVIAPRLSLGGLASHGETTVSILGEGLLPGSERDLSRTIHVLKGQPLDESDPHGLILGEGLAEQLGANIDDTVVLLATTQNGGLNAVEGRVRGIFYSSVRAYDDVAVRMDLNLAKQLLRIDGAHRYLVLLSATDSTDSVLRSVRAILGTKLEASPWYDNADYYHKTVALFSRQLLVMELIVGLIVLLTITNSMVMSVLERTHEIGTALALGTKRRQIRLQFVIEGLVLGIAGGLAGIGLGLLLGEIISWIGIPMPPAPQMRHGFTGAIRITGSLSAFALITVVSACFLASIYPAWKASKLDIVDALRHGK